MLLPEVLDFILYSCHVIINSQCSTKEKQNIAYKNKKHQVLYANKCKHIYSSHLLRTAFIMFYMFSTHMFVFVYIIFTWGHEAMVELLCKIFFHRQHVSTSLLSFFLNGSCLSSNFLYAFEFVIRSSLHKGFDENVEDISNSFGNAYALL